MKQIILAAALFFLALAKLHATEALIFDGGGYYIQILVGQTDQAVIAEVRFTPPGAKDWVSLPRNRLRIERFNFDNRILILHFSRQNDAALPASFSLTVKKENAVLSINGKRIRSSLDWEI